MLVVDYVRTESAKSCAPTKILVQNLTQMKCFLSHKAVSVLLASWQTQDLRSFALSLMIFGLESWSVSLSSMWSKWAAQSMSHTFSLSLAHTHKDVFKNSCWWEAFWRTFWKPDSSPKFLLPRSWPIRHTQADWIILIICSLTVLR